MSSLPKALLIFVFVIPLAILMGFFLADPTDSTSLIGVGLFLFLLLTPILIRFHHSALIVSATAFINAFFLPGRPEMWMLLAGISLVVSVASWPLDRESRLYCGIRSLDLAVIFMVLVVLFTMRATGGTGFNIMGAQVFGGRRYVTMLAAAVGYFALVLHPLSVEKAKTLGAAFWAMSGTAILGNVAFALGPNFYFFFYLFPVEFVLSQANAEDITLSGGVVRLSGLAPLGFGVVYWLMARFGLVGIMDLRKSWRFILSLAAIIAIMMAGFRSNIILLAILIIVLFFLEKLHRTFYAGLITTVLLVFSVLIIGFSDRLPMTIQRSLSFLPIKVNSVAKADAEGSLQWRLDMWKVVVRDIPEYFWIGKGFSINPTDMYFTKEALRRGFYSPSEAARLAGDYHNGPLSIMIPFGIFGAVGFIWFLVSIYAVLKNNYRYGSHELKTINRFFLGFFIARVFFFVFFFGAATSDFWLFASVAGLNLSMNRGMATKPAAIHIEQVNVTEKNPEPARIDIPSPMPI